MRGRLFRLAGELAEKGQAFALAVVVRREPASSAQAGDAALITQDGDFHGWLGGSCTQPTVVEEALRALRDGRPRLVVLAPQPERARRPGVVVFPMACQSGGTVEIYLEPVLPPPRLVLFGATPVITALIRLGKAMGFRVTVVDPAAEREPFATADERLTALDAPELRPPATIAGTTVYAVVATMGDHDEEAIRTAVELRPDYLGVVASRRRFEEVRATLAARGVPAETLRSIHSPAGIDIGARTAEEIGVSVLAEIVQTARARQAEEPAADEPAVAAEATDPVCGMSVAVAGARHQAEHQGSSYFFCCGGCRERFLADPGRYLPRPDDRQAPAH